MSQIFSTKLQAYMARESVKLSYFVEIDSATPYMMHSGVGEITHNGKTYYGVGSLGNVSRVRQTGELESSPITLTLSCVVDENGNNPILDEALQHSFVMKNARVYIGAVEDDDNHKVHAMDLLYSGFISDVGITAGDNPSISLKVATKLDKWRKGKPDRYSYESHRGRQPNDNFFKYQAATSTMDIRWGNTVTSERFRY